MMERRQFLRRCALIAAGVVAADQLDVLEMLAPRRLFAGWSPPQKWGGVGHYWDAKSLADLWVSTNAKLAQALTLTTEEATWFRETTRIKTTRRAPVAHLSVIGL